MNGGDLEAPRYRIEHRYPEAAALILGFRDDARRPQTALEPDAEALLAAGAAGEVVLVDQATEAVVARRHLVGPAFGP